MHATTTLLRQLRALESASALGTGAVAFRGDAARCILGRVTTGFGNEQAKDAVRRTLKGGSSGRVAVFVIVAAFLALGIYTGNILITVPSGIATVLAVRALIQAGWRRRAARRMERGWEPTER